MVGNEPTGSTGTVTFDDIPYVAPLPSGTLTNGGPWTGGIVTRFE